MIRLNVSLSRKVGLPEFGSVGASLSLEFEADSAMLSDPAAFRTYVETHYELVGSLVDAELARQCGRTEAPAAAPEPARNGHSNGAAAPGRISRPSRPATVRGDRDGARVMLLNDKPRDGKQLYPWARKQEEAGVTGLVKFLEAFGVTKGFPKRFVEWGRDETEAAYSAALDRYNPEPN